VLQFKRVGVLLVWIVSLSAIIHVSMTDPLQQRPRSYLVCPVGLFG
jgi:hypothetical protein